MVVCLTSARFNMKADILKSGTESQLPPTDDNPDGEWIIEHDEDSNEIIRKWVPSETDDPETPDYEGLKSFKCLARGIVSNAIGGGGTTESFGDIYQADDFVRIWFPAGTPITRRDRITNIRGPRGDIMWREEERTDRAPTVFAVVGVTPLIDPFGRHTESVALLERSETQ